MHRIKHHRACPRGTNEMNRASSPRTPIGYTFGVEGVELLRGDVEQDGALVKVARSV
jgi:hypothetical protein